MAGASVAAILALALAACGSGGTSGGGGGSGGGGSSSGGGQAGPVAKYPWCGPSKATIALADGFGDNTWRELTRYSAVTIAAQCPSVTKYIYANGEGNTQKAISDINALVAQGVTGIVDFPDAGKAMLPVLTKAYHEGTIVVPYRVFPGGTAGTNYNAYISTNFTAAGVLSMMATALPLVALVAAGLAAAVLVDSPASKDPQASSPSEAIKIRFMMFLDGSIFP